MGKIITFVTDRQLLLYINHHQVGGHLDRKQEQRQAGEQMKREQVTVDSKANVLQRRFSEADYARLGRMQGGVDTRSLLKMDYMTFRIFR